MSCSLGKRIFYKEINDDKSFKQEKSFAWWKYWCRFWNNQSTQEIENVSIPWSSKFQKGGSKFYGKVDWKAQGTISFEVWSILYHSNLDCFTCKQVQETLRMFSWISSDTADEAKSEYKAFVNDQAIVNELATFDIHSDRIDVVLGKLMQSRTHLWEAVKLCLILSHGNANVDSEFLTNEQILDHKQDTSLVTQFIVYEGIQSVGVLKVDINKKLLPYVQGAHVEYSQALGENNKMESAGEKWKQNRRRLNNELKNAKRAKTESMTAHGKEMKKHDSKIHALEEELWSIKWSYQCLLFLLVIVFHKNLNTVRNRSGICDFFLAPDILFN